MRKWICAALALVLALGMVFNFAQPVSAADPMTVSDDFIEVLKKMEGFRPYPYWDYAQYSIGYGTRCPDGMLSYYQANGISVEAAVELLHKELKSFERSVNNFSAKHGLEFSQHQFDALVSISYNCGAGWMGETTGYLYNAIKNGYTGTKLVYAMGLYSSAGGSYILMPRRLCEANMYLNGVYRAYNSGDDAIPETYKWVRLDGGAAEVRYKVCAYDAAENKPVDVIFKKIPTGVDSNGNPFVYELEGWYTASGRRIDALDMSLSDGETLYAKWKSPDDVTSDPPEGEEVEIEVTVTADKVNVRKGPGTDYDIVGSVSSGEKLVITALYKVGDYTWGKFEKGWLRLDFTDYQSQESAPSTFPKKGTVNTNNVNYRTKPEVGESTLVGQKNKGDRVTIVEEWYSGSMWWGKMDDGYWIALQYVTYDDSANPFVTGIEMWTLPKTTYIVGEALDTAGGVVRVNYSNGTADAVSLTPMMVSGFSSEAAGTIELLVTYNEETTTYTVTIIDPIAPGDTNQDGNVNNDDVVYLMWHGLFPDQYPLEVEADFSADGEVNNDDVVYLMWHVLFPENYPLA